MMGDVVQMPDGSDLVAQMKGAERSGCSVVIDGRCIPRLVMHDKDTEVVFVLDDRLAFGFPKNLAHLAASFAANAMAIGAGFPSLTADRKVEAFAPAVIGLDELPT